MTEEVGTAGLGPPWTEDIRRPPRLPGRWRQSRTDDSGQFGATDTALGPRPAPEGRHRHSTYPRARRSLRRPTWMDPSRASGPPLRSRRSVFTRLSPGRSTAVGDLGQGHGRVVQT